jgi:hypothetical protein
MSQKNRSKLRGGVTRRSRAGYFAEPLESRVLLSHTWYVATTGSNANAGTLAAPFKTIQYAANNAYAGDTVMVEGGTYHETVTVPHSGTSTAKIIFENYNNESVTIDGADPITGWTNTGGSVWSAPMSTNLGEGNNQVFVDGQMMNEARWPNTPLILTPGGGFDLTHPVLDTVTSVSTAPTDTTTPTLATITDPNLTQPAGFWDGAIIRIGSGQNWGNQTGVVTDSGTGYLTFSYVAENVKYTVPIAGNQYYLFGTPAALDAPGEWIRASGQLSLWTPTGDSAANHVVEVKHRQYGFNASGVSYIRIQGFHFFACSIDTNSHSAHVVIDQITDQYVSQFAISSNGSTSQQPSGIILAGLADCVEYSVIVDSAGDGVNVSGSMCVVSNNLIHDVDYSGTDGAPVVISGYGDVITQNTCYNTARDGFLFYGNHDTITYNDVYNYGLQTEDLGGFYAGTIDGKGTVIAYNEFHDGITGGYGGDGIRLDDSSSNFIIYRNITWNVNVGIGMNGNTLNVQIYNNTFDALDYSMAKDGFLTDDWTGTILENNILTHPIEFGLNVQLIDNISNHHMFVDAATGNFTLLAGSPAVDSGMVLPPYTNGYVGAAPDVGALELGLPPFVTGTVLGSIPPDPTA